MRGRSAGRAGRGAATSDGRDALGPPFPRGDPTCVSDSCYKAEEEVGEKTARHDRRFDLRLERVKEESDTHGTRLTEGEGCAAGRDVGPGCGGAFGEGGCWLPPGSSSRSSKTRRGPSAKKKSKGIGLMV